MAIAKVWVVNTGRHDYSPASEWGVITPILHGPVDIFNPDIVIAEMTKKLNAHASENDWVIMSSHTFLNLLVGHYFFKRFKKVNCLIYLHSTGDYRAMTVYDFDLMPS